MFPRKKKVLVRILDSPRSMIIDPKFIAVPLPNGKILILQGDFENVSDQEAFRLAANAADQAKVA